MNLIEIKTIGLNEDTGKFSIGKVTIDIDKIIYFGEQVAEDEATEQLGIKKYTEIYFGKNKIMTAMIKPKELLKLINKKGETKNV